MMKNTIILLITSSLFFSCKTKAEDTSEKKVITGTVEETAETYSLFVKNMSREEKDTLLTNLATFIIRKPASATWETKFDPEFRKYYESNRSELELIYLQKIADTFYYYLLREARTNEGLKKRGVGGKYTVDGTTNSIQDFEEIFVSRVLPESDLKKIGNQYMRLATAHSDLTALLTEKDQIEWPDGRLFYSKQKKEWRYVE